MVRGLDGFCGTRCAVFNGRRRLSKVSGGYGEGETPLPFPNRAVKPLSADGTWPARAWESRSPPVSCHIGRPASAGRPMLVLARVWRVARGAAESGAARDRRQGSHAHVCGPRDGASAAWPRGPGERGGVRVRAVAGTGARLRRQHVVEHVAERPSGRDEAGGKPACHRSRGDGGSGLGCGPQEHVFVR